MKESAYRILDILAREIGNPMSINQLKERINRIYGSADYKNTYMSMQDMWKRGFIIIEKIGKSSIATLNFDSPLLIDFLAEMEMRRKTLFLEKRQELQLLLLQLNAYLKDFYFIKSISLINPQRNAALNRLELLILLKDSKSKRDIESETKEIKAKIEILKKIYNIRIDVLFLNGKKFLDLLKSNEINLARELLSDKIVLSHPQIFWLDLMNALQEGMNIKIHEGETNPAKISEENIVFNLGRFGYKEFGTPIIKGNPFGIEFLITAILLKRSKIRRIEAIPIILAKNRGKANYTLLIFLAAKYNVLKKLYEILKILNAIKPMEEVKKALDNLKDTVTKRQKSGQDVLDLKLKDLEKQMRLYDAIR